MKDKKMRPTRTFARTNREAERLKKSVDILRVLDYCGVTLQKRGCSYFLCCPSPGHKDHEPYMNCYCQAGWKNVLCKRCGKSFNSADVIMYLRHCDYGQAMDILWELAGRPAWYQERSGKPAEPSVTIFELTKSEREILGIHLPSSFTRSECCSKAETVYLCRQDFLQDRDYALMVQSKAYEKQKEMETIKQEILQMTGKAVDGPESLLIKAAEESIKVCANVIARSRDALKCAK